MIPAAVGSVLGSALSSALPSALDTSAIFGLSWLDPEAILTWLGPWALVGVTLIIFAECGILLGFFLPGDSLLFVTGMFIASGAIKSPIWLAIVILSVAAILGNLCGYWIGHAVGPKLFDKPDSRFFKAEHVDRTHAFFEKWGARAIILARFVPIVRTFITAFAGIGKMDFRKYMTYSTIGGILWVGLITTIGYLLGNVEFIKKNVEYIAVLIVLISAIPIFIEVIRSRREAKREQANKTEGQTDS